MPVNGTDPAYPTIRDDDCPENELGMDIRTWIASGKHDAILGSFGGEMTTKEIAALAIVHADALIGELNKPEEPEGE